MPKQSISISLLFLFSYSVLNAFAQSESMMLIPTDDAHVLADLGDPTDSLGLMQKNVGNLETIELLSSWNVTGPKNAFVAIAYLKFDISKQNLHNLEKAELKMLAREVALSESPKNVVLVHVPNNNWKESDITYLKRPSFSTTAVSTVAIESSNTWYSWDVTDLVKQNPGSELSIALTFDVAKDNTQDYVSFYSKESENKDNLPYLALSYSEAPPIPLVDSSLQGTNYAPVIISGIIGAGVAAFTTKLIISRKEQKPKVISRQSSTQLEKVQCKNCGKILPKQFKFCPFCSTQI